MAIKKRNLPSNFVQDTGAIDVLTYSDQGGSWKVSEIGRNLIPLGDGAGAFTTDASTARILPAAGLSLAIYNSDTLVHAITLGTSAPASALAAGATNASGQVGIACAPGEYTYIACYYNNWVIADSNTLFVYLINDSTSITPESNNFATN